jgi:hypothetical protein
MKCDSITQGRNAILSRFLLSRGNENFIAALTVAKKESFLLSLNKCQCCQSESTAGLDDQGKDQDKVPLVYRDEEMIQKLYEWSKSYGGKAVVPKSVHDGRQLGSWLRRVRKLKGGMTPEDIERLNKAGMVWEMNVLESKWFSNFHLVREYIECHPGCDVDLEMTSEFDHPDRSDWVEASRWLIRQKELYRKQKLTKMKVRLLKGVLGTQYRLSEVKQFSRMY